ncbi:Formamidopyrimidine-DNA glycosylase [Corynebacterium terpenotabidum Y-11]|uniref:DNA-(apurinic or apyrimidinic site) lyase n=1 Tax=Corynebacterium terpenotabidum Y-11 TaxID=1200352 RepID=S4XAH2_9CORY|nr:Formamidopyrimidine-DNA glycosylase [Corynebacterium terpenotabidum Y-11]
MIHRLATGLTDAFAGSLVAVSSPQGRFAAEAALLDGSELVDAEAWGKHLFVHFSAGTVHIHLGLIGTLQVEPVAAPRGQVRLRIADAVVAADLRGPQRCALVTPDEEDAVIGRLGVDPLRPVDQKLDMVLAKTRRSAKPIGALLMEQNLYAGVGSIYRTEVLFREGIDPRRPGTSLSAEELDAIWADMVMLMRYGEQHGRIDTVRDEHTPEAMGRPPRKDDHGGEVYVYRRAGLPCLVCGAPVETGEMAGRKIYWCPVCQQM